MVDVTRAADRLRPGPEQKKPPPEPLLGGCRGHLNGQVAGNLRAAVKVQEVQITLSAEAAYALCNILTDAALANNGDVGDRARNTLSNLGAAVGRLIDHHSANNGGRDFIK